MIKWMIALGLLLFCGIIQAHQPNLSSTMLVQQEDDSWILQIRAPLTAFQYEVKAKNNTYSTPEEFQELLIQHVKENLQIHFNQQDLVSFQQAFVKLGHETNLVFQLAAVPEEINSVYVKNSSFKNIHRNQSALVILKKGFSKEQFILNNQNQHTAKLVAEDAQFVVLGKEVVQTDDTYLYLITGIIILFLGIYVCYSIDLKTIKEWLKGPEFIEQLK